MCKARAFFSTDPESIIPEVNQDIKVISLGNPYNPTEKEKSRWLRIVNNCKTYEHLRERFLSKGKSPLENLARFYFAMRNENAQKILSIRPSLDDMEPNLGSGSFDDEDDREAVIEYGCIDVEYSPT